jgi:hypothetical protein
LCKCGASPRLDYLNAWPCTSRNLARLQPLLVYYTCSAAVCCTWSALWHIPRAIHQGCPGMLMQPGTSCRHLYVASHCYLAIWPPSQAGFG